MKDGSKYMAIHQHDEDANDLWLYFQEVISWAKRLFPNIDKKLTKEQNWGLLYEKYKDEKYNSNNILEDIKKLLQDEDVTKQSGIIPYVLSKRTKADEKLLSIRAFPEQMKRRVYEKQDHRCPMCISNGINKQYNFDEMQGDHIVAWSKGGKTVEDNCQMLCSSCNNSKSDK